MPIGGGGAQLAGGLGGQVEAPDGSRLMGAAPRDRAPPRYRDDPYVPGARIEVGGALDTPGPYVDDPYVPGARITRARLSEITEMENFLQSVIDQIDASGDDRPAGPTRIGGQGGTSLPGDYGAVGSPGWMRRAASDARNRFIDRPPPGRANATQAGGVDDVFG